tara:strand:+ start:120 stop:485 length:366 start_codon:yes stop_codon:yes gene_type:complete
LISKSVSNLKRRHDAKNIIAVGDFNVDRRMDDNPTGTKFALKDTYPVHNFFDAILDMGFHDCMRKYHSEPVQTHSNPKCEFPWELDHMSATKELFDNLIEVNIPDTLTISDHKPIIATFDV